MDATSGTGGTVSPFPKGGFRYSKFVVDRDEWQELIAFYAAQGNTAGENALVSLAVLVGANLDQDEIDALADEYRQEAAGGKRPGATLPEDPEWSGAAEAAARAILAGWAGGSDGQPGES